MRPSGVTVTFTALANSGATYSWDFDDGSTGSGRILSHTVRSASTYNVVLTVSRSRWQRHSTTVAINVPC